MISPGFGCTRYDIETTVAIAAPAQWRSIGLQPNWKSAPAGFADLVKFVTGWVITIAAISLGAPFWFDLLGKVANLRGSGGKTGGSLRRAASYRNVL